MRRIDDVMAYMVFEKLGREPVHCTSHRRDEHEHVRATEFGFERTLDCLDLALDAPDPADELGLILDGMCHMG